jgi:hypothetical protein
VTEPLAGIWVKFLEKEDLEWSSEPEWITMERAWFLETRAALAEACEAQRAKPTSPRRWVEAQLSFAGLRLSGRDASLVPRALYQRVLVAEGGSWESGPRGNWSRLPNIFPADRTERTR